MPMRKSPSSSNERCLRMPQPAAVANWLRRRREVLPYPASREPASFPPFPKEAVSARPKTEKCLPSARLLLLLLSASIPIWRVLPPRLLWPLVGVPRPGPWYPGARGGRCLHTLPGPPQACPAAPAGYCSPGACPPGPGAPEGGCTGTFGNKSCPPDRPVRPIISRNRRETAAPPRQNEGPARKGDSAEKCTVKAAGEMYPSCCRGGRFS